MGYLCDFRLDQPPYTKSQEESFDWLAEEYSHHNHETSASRFKSLLKRVGAKPPQIESRAHYLSEYLSIDSERFLFKRESPPTMIERMKVFEKVACGIFERLLKGKKDFHDLIHVSCTGYISPSPAQKWVIGNQTHDQVHILHFYHMGCYAALPAIRQAFSLSHMKRRIEICHTELCTFHFNPLHPSPEDMVMQTLFADGACAYRFQQDKPETPSLKYLDSHEEILPNSLEAMTWGLAKEGFKMTLSKDVPNLVKQALPNILSRWLKDRLDLKDQTIIWAIHPGGPKIIDEIQSLFRLNDTQVKYSREILRSRGNMSSATLPHIWQNLLNDEEVKDKTPVLSMAFGPGLTVSLAHLEVRK